MYTKILTLLLTALLFGGCFSNDDSSAATSSGTSSSANSETPSSSGGSSSASVSGSLYLDISNPSLGIGESTTATVSIYGILSGQSATVNLTSSPSGFVRLSKSSCTLSVETSSCDFTITGVSGSDGSLSASVSGTDITTVAPLSVGTTTGVLKLSLNPVIYDGSLNPATIQLIGAGSGTSPVTVSLTANDTVASSTSGGFKNIEHIFFKTIDIASSFIFTNAYAADEIGSKDSKILTFLNETTRDAITSVVLNSSNDFKQTILVDGVGVGKANIELTATSYIAPKVQLEMVKAVKGHIIASLASPNIKSGGSTTGSVKLEKSEGVSPFKVSISSADSNVTISNTSPSPCLLSSSSAECTFTATGKGSAESFITIVPFGYDTINLPINVDSKKGTISLALDKNQITVGGQATATLTLEDSEGISGVKTTITSIDTRTVSVEDKSCYLSSASKTCTIKLYAQDIPRNGVKISAEANGYVITPKFIDVLPEYGTWSISPSTISIDRVGDKKEANITLSSSAIGVTDFVPQLSSISNARATVKNNCRLSSKNRSCTIEIEGTKSGTSTLTISASHYEDLKPKVVVGSASVGYLDFNTSTLSLKTGESQKVKLSLEGVEKSTSITLTPSKSGIISLSSCSINSPAYSCDVNITALSTVGSLQLVAKASDSSIHTAAMSIDVKDGTVSYGKFELSVASSMEPSKNTIATLRLVDSSNVDSISDLKVESNDTGIITNPTLPTGCESNLTTMGNHKCSFTVTSDSTAGSAKITATAKSGSHNYSAEQNITVRTMPASRFVSVENNCSGDVFVQYTGGAANAIACSPGTKQCTTQLVEIYGDEFKNWQCNASYFCEPSTGGSCPNGMEFNSTIGGCKCSTNADCQYFSEGSVCNASGVCEYAFGQKAINKVASNKNIVFTLTKNLKKPIINSGNIAFLTGCDVNGTNCHQKSFMTSPSEFTLMSNGNDYYDLSYINSVIIPVSVEPVDENNNSLVPSTNEQGMEGYFCGINGATTSQTTTPGLQNFRCEYDYVTRFNSTSAGANNIAYNYVDDNGTNCSTDSNCTAPEVCGLSYATASTGGTQTTCGKRRGYWTYTSLCSLPVPRTNPTDNHSSYVNANMGIDCITHSQYALCLTSSNNPLVSGWKHSSGQCGCAYWTSDTSAPLKDLPGTDQESDCHSASDWTTYIKPKVKVVKEGCPSAYSHQYDDPYSTFQCSNFVHGANMANYRITLCPSGKENNISFAP